MPPLVPRRRAPKVATPGRTEAQVMAGVIEVQANHQERAMRRAANKYGAVKTARDGVTYDSKAEAKHAERLDLLKRAGAVRWWLRQVPVMIGEPGVDKPYRVDFVVCEADGRVFADEVKGVETTLFKRQKKQWAKRGPFPLRVYRGRVVETIEPGGEID